MKLFLISFLLVLQAHAQEPPQTFIVSRYNDLWQNSPFTDPPVVIPPGEKNDLEDWVLVGLRKGADGTHITLVNKKDSKQRVQVPGGRSDLAKEFRILEVNPDPSGSVSKTVVMVQKGEHRGPVTFDRKYLTIRKAPAQRGKAPNPASKGKTPAKTPPSLPGGTGAVKPGTTPTKAPRTRYIPKPKK
ncbi:hypothetical protein N9H94_01850 [Akkermansiaceae bacterium]|nr:hypothetical protein [Akkermansiaceae bacterium]